MHVVVTIIGTAILLPSLCTRFDACLAALLACCLQAARMLDMCMSGFVGHARTDCYYEFIRERNVLEAFKAVMLRVLLPASMPAPEHVASLTKPALERYAFARCSARSPYLLFAFITQSLLAVIRCSLFGFHSCLLRARLFAALPPRQAVAARNIHSVVTQLSDQMSKAALSLRSSGQLLTEEDVIKVRLPGFALQFTALMVLFVFAACNRIIPMETRSAS